MEIAELLVRSLPWWRLVFGILYLRIYIDSARFETICYRPDRIITEVSVSRELPNVEHTGSIDQVTPSTENEKTPTE